MVMATILFFVLQNFTEDYVQKINLLHSLQSPLSMQYRFSQKKRQKQDTAW
jgi:hypothetical protein